MSVVEVPLHDFTCKVHRALTGLGLENEEATVVTDVLMYAETRGSSQGIIKIKERTILPDANCTPVKTINRTPAITTIDGGGHTGMYVLQHAVVSAKSSVAACGIALVTTSNTRSSTGAIGYYAQQLSDDGYIAIVLAGSPKVAAVASGIDPVLGTNPIAIAIPTSGESLIFDSAMAAITWFDVIKARDSNTLLPKQVAIDINGAPTRDPLAAMQGALKTIAGAKGSGLALMFEFLTASLSNSAIAGDATDNRGNTIICIDPRQVLGGKQFYRNADALIKRIRSSRPDNESDTIRLPGDRSEARAAHCERVDRIAIDRALFEEIERLQATSR